MTALSYLPPRPANVPYSCPVNVSYSCPANVPYSCPTNVPYSRPTNVSSVASGGHANRTGV